MDEPVTEGQSHGHIAQLALSTSDQYQMYAYLRLEQCPRGFFMVPFWDARAEAKSVAVRSELRFRRSPLDGDADCSVHVIALNLMHSPKLVMDQATTLLQGWYRV